MRPSGRQAGELRKIEMEPGYAKNAEGSCMIKAGDTHVLCTASIEERVPPFLRNTGKGWVTAEYGMLPRSTGQRMGREAARGKQQGRTVEIQRLIGRSLRAVVNMEGFGERQITVDCDVIQADGGTRTASITGAYVALYQAFNTLVEQGKILEVPMQQQVAAVSCGIYKGVPVLDLDYPEDSNAQADANFVLSSDGRIIEIQGTAEEDPFTETQFTALFDLAKSGVKELCQLQRKALGL